VVYSVICGVIYIGWVYRVGVVFRGIGCGIA
jgi:hypothetical protein